MKNNISLIFYIRRFLFSLFQCVQMAHALRRISYATCEPRHAQFSFLAREPRAHFSIQYCHSFVTESAEQVSPYSSNFFFILLRSRKKKRKDRKSIEIIYAKFCLNTFSSTYTKSIIRKST